MSELEERRYLTIGGATLPVRALHESAFDEGLGCDGSQVRSGRRQGVLLLRTASWIDVDPDGGEAG